MLYWDEECVGEFIRCIGHQRNTNKTTLRYHLITIEMTVIKKTNHNVWVRIWRKGNTYAGRTVN